MIFGFRRNLAPSRLIGALIALVLVGTVSVVTPASADDVNQNVRNLQAVTDPETVTPHSLLVSWDAPLSSGVTDYQLDIATTGASSLPDFPLIVSTTDILFDPDNDASALGLVFTNLEPGTSYTVTVSAMAGQELWPASSIGASTAPLPDPPPDVATNLVLTPEVNAIVATWEAPNDTGGSALTGYRIEVWPPTVSPIELGEVTSHTISGLQQETNYTVSVVALNTSGESIATTSAVRTLAPVGVARLSGATATTSDSITTLSAQVADSGRPTSWGRVGFLVSRTDPPLLNENTTFLPAIGGFSRASGTITATINSLVPNELYFVRSVLEATYGEAGVKVSYGNVTPYAITERTIRFTNLGAFGAAGPTQEAADGYSRNAGGSLQHRVEIRENEHGIQRYQVDYPGAYRVTAVGAAGGGPSDRAGRGAVVSGSFVFDQNDPLMVAVGQLATGTRTTTGQATQTVATRGGGGGTFLTEGTELDSAVPLLIAGGGGGAGSESFRVFQGRAHGRAPSFGDVEAPGQLGGRADRCYGIMGCNSALGGTGGSGGAVQHLVPYGPPHPISDTSVSFMNVIAAGGGFHSHGQDGYARGPFCPSRPFVSNPVTCETGSGGRSFRSGAKGGFYSNKFATVTPNVFLDIVREGGFGGGGAGRFIDQRGGGGGGGYNGGGGSVTFAGLPGYDGHLSTTNISEAGGGGSYNAGTSPDGITGGGAAGAPGYLEMRLLASQPVADTTQLGEVRAGQPVSLTSRVASTGGDFAVERGFLVSSLPDSTLDSPDTLRIIASGVGDGVFTAATAPLPARSYLFVRSYVKGYGGVGYGPLRTLRTFRGVEITTAGVTGAEGPTQSALNAAYAGTPLAGLVTTSLSASVPQGIQLVTVSASGRYRIQALGARGGVYTPPGFDTPQGGNLGGRGALAEATFDFEAGDTLVVLVGQRPDNEGGGGGATFVAKGTGLDDPDLQPLLVAGGGGAVSFPFDSGPTDADATYPLGSATNSAASLVEWSGTNGGGGSVVPGNQIQPPGWAGGGGGYSGDGAPGDEMGLPAAQGGKGFLNGGVGGQGAACDINDNDTVIPSGGFGGGGAGATHFRPSCWAQGGNGGGYNGAGNFGPRPMDLYPRLGRGGGSLVTGADRGGSGGVNEGDGKVVLTLVPAPQPNPLLPGVGAPRSVTVGGAAVERAPGSVLAWRNGSAVQVQTITPANTTTSARTFIDTTVGSDTAGLLLDVVEGAGSSGTQIIGLFTERGTDELLPVPVGAITGVSTSAGTDEIRMLLAGTDDQDEVRLRGTSGEPVAGAGGRISSILTGLPPGTQGEVSLRSEPRLLGSFTVDANGVAAFVADVPGDIAPGAHTLVVATFSDGQETQAVVSVGITVRPRSSSGAPSTGTPQTGTTPPTATTPETRPIPVPPAPLARGESSVTENGVAVPIDVTRESGGGLALRGPDFDLALGDRCAPSCTVELGADGQPLLRLDTTASLDLAGSGFLPDSTVYVWMFSDPTFLGELTVDANGRFAGEVSLGGIAPGDHVLQISGTNPNGDPRAVNLGVIVTASSNETTPPGLGLLPVTGGGGGLILWAILLLGFGTMSVTTRRRVAGRRRYDRQRRIAESLATDPLTTEESQIIRSSSAAIIRNIDAGR